MFHDMDVLGFIIFMFAFTFFRFLPLLTVQN